ncbi:MAG: hypothetical protein AB8F78_05955 [Saprospiraceae bacterium]
MSPKNTSRIRALIFSAGLLAFLLQLTSCGRDTSVPNAVAVPQAPVPMVMPPEAEPAISSREEIATVSADIAIREAYSFEEGVVPPPPPPPPRLPQIEEVPEEVDIEEEIVGEPLVEEELVEEEIPEEYETSSVIVMTHNDPAIPASTNSSGISQVHEENVESPSAPTEILHSEPAMDVAHSQTAPIVFRSPVNTQASSLGSSSPTAETVLNETPFPTASILPQQAETVATPPSRATFGVACPDTMRYGIENAVVATFQVEISDDSTEILVTTLLKEKTLSQATMAIAPHVDVLTINNLQGIVEIEAHLITSSEDKFKWAAPLAPKVRLTEAPMVWTWQVVPQEKSFTSVLQVALIGHYADGSTQPLFGGASGHSYPVTVISTSADWASTIFSEVSGEWKWFLVVFVFPVFKWGYAKWKTMKEKKKEGKAVVA